MNKNIIISFVSIVTIVILGCNSNGTEVEQEEVRNLRQEIEQLDEVNEELDEIIQDADSMEVLLHDLEN